MAARCLFLSVQLEGNLVSESPSNRVATRPWLAFQAKAMGKKIENKNYRRTNRLTYGHRDY